MQLDIDCIWKFTHRWALYHLCDFISRFLWNVADNELTFYFLPSACLVFLLQRVSVYRKVGDVLPPGQTSLVFLTSCQQLLIELVCMVIPLQYIHRYYICMMSMRHSLITLSPPRYVIAWLTLTVLVATIDAQWEGMGDVGLARYEPALLPPCPTIRVLSYSN